MMIILLLLVLLMMMILINPAKLSKFRQNPRKKSKIGTLPSQIFTEICISHTE
jgi:hypothetical protein